MATAVICTCLASAGFASVLRFLPAAAMPAAAAETTTIDPPKEASPAGTPEDSSKPAAAAQAQKPADGANSDATKPDAPQADDPKLAGRFRGRVTGPDGKPLRGARISIIPITTEFTSIFPVNAAVKDPGRVRAESDAEGRFEFDAPDMTFLDDDGHPARKKGFLVASADGLAPDWMTTWGQNESAVRSHWDPVKGAPIDLQLPLDDVPIHGRFLGPDGKPLAGAKVRLWQILIPQKRDLDAHLAREVKASFANSTDYERSAYRPDLLPGVTTETETDSDGRFTLSGIGRDRLVQLMVKAPTVIDSELTVMTRDVPDVQIRQGDGPALKVPSQWIRGAGFTVQLERGRTITGVVRDLNSKRPIPGMWVGLRSRRGGGFLSPEHYPWVTDEQGRFRITGLYPSTKREGVIVVSAPGMKFRTASADVEDDKEVTIECMYGIPFRLKLMNEQGQPVEAEVTYTKLWPNPLNYDDAERNPWPASRAARKPDGTYEGFLLPGPGAVLVKTPRGSGYRPARVDPKPFFIPGWTAGTAKEEFLFYGDPDTLATGAGGKLLQNDYAAIVLVNPPNSIDQHELSATVIKDRPRQVYLVDAEGQPVTGVETQGMTLEPYDAEPRQRAANFFITGLHPERVRRITFLQEKRQLIGALAARGDGDTPYTVRMQPWGTIAGRLVDESGHALPIHKPESDWIKPPNVLLSREGLSQVDTHRGAATDNEGRFKIDRIVPDERYSARIYGGRENQSEAAFENVVVSAGDTRDLGDIRTRLSFGPEYRRAWVGDEQETGKIPADAWGPVVNGLRVALVLQSPLLDPLERLRYEIVAENVSDHDIRFGAAVHYENGFHKIELVDADGKQPVRQAGPVPEFADGPNLKRFWLKPNKRIVIAPCATRLSRLDEAGQLVPSPERPNFYHQYNVRPGRYFLSATVELGQRFEYVDQATGTRTVRSPLEGEWTGKLRTGVVPVSLFE
ncbi:MAG TPA: hypothetical protein VL475_15030, partial [Planctomycetaceae bacterium]|nr:hypothetical protein [Planctomycetaceae bacterium]